MNINSNIGITLSTGQNLENFATGLCANKSYRLEVPEDHNGTLDSIWYKATEMCHSSQLKTFLRKKGKLSSLHVDRSTACNFLSLFLVLLFIYHSVKNFPHHSIAAFCCYVWGGF